MVSFLQVSGSQPMCRGTLVGPELLPSVPPIYFPITFSCGKIDKHNQNCVHQPRICKIFLDFGVPPSFFYAKFAANLKRLKTTDLSLSLSQLTSFANQKSFPIT